MNALKRALLGLPLTALPFALACEAPPENPGFTDPDEHEHEDDERLKARVWAADPLTNEALTEVTLVEPTSEDGTLTNDYVNALNCLNQEGGPNLFGFASLCVEAKTVFPDERGSYLHVEPPPVDSDQEDPFAELMMYHHVGAMHDYYADVHGFTELDFPLDAVVNVTLNFGGGWQSFANAAFIPAESFSAFGLPEREFGAIMFGQGDVDFSYDASVIFHEYSHAMVGTERLQGAFLDGQGLNNTPGAINEAVADYFAATVLGDTAIGPYALGAFARDLSRTKRCPEDLTTAIHTDGEIVGAALWAVREEIGADLTDAIVFDAVRAAGLATGFEELAALVLDETGRQAPDRFNVVEVILQEHGLVDCDRVKPWTNVNFATTTGLPISVEGRQTAGDAFPDGVPGYLQLSVAPTEAAFVELEWAQVEGGGGPFGGEPSPLSIALRAGERVSVQLTGGLSADAIIDGPFVDGTEQRVVVDNSCVADGLFTLFVNKAGPQAQVARLGLRELDAAPEGVEVVSCP